MTNHCQDKRKEIEFFNSFAEKDPYNVFTDAGTMRLIRAIRSLGVLKPNGLTADLGCGSGVFTKILQNEGYRVLGLDISLEIMRAGKRNYPNLSFVTGDVERLPLAGESLDGVLLSGHQDEANGDS